MSDKNAEWHPNEIDEDRETVGAVMYAKLKGLLQPVRRPDGLIGYGLTPQARAMLKDINAERGILMSLMTINKLEELAQRHIAIPAPPPKPLQITARDARYQILGGIKIIARICGVDMTQDIHPAQMLMQRIDLLEAEKEQQQQEIIELRKALASVATVLEIHETPFDLKPASKWNKVDMGQWMLAAGESIKWVMQRAENALDPAHIVPIAPDPE